MSNKPLCYGGIVVPESIELEDTDQYRNVFRDVDADALDDLMDQLCNYEQEPDAGSFKIEDFSKIQIVAVLSLYREKLENLAEQHEIPMIVWNRVTPNEMDQVSDQFFDIVLAANPEDTSILQPLWKRAKHNPESSFILAEWADPDEIVELALSELNTSHRRAFYHTLHKTDVAPQEIEQICEDVLQSSYFQRIRH